MARKMKEVYVIKLRNINLPKQEEVEMFKELDEITNRLQGSVTKRKADDNITVDADFINKYFHESNRYKAYTKGLPTTLAGNLLKLLA